MNISQMMRSFLGEAAASDSRAVELKVGQIVRGVILQVMENNEALVQINGVQVRAKLELPLQVGQSAMLQVQPQSSGAMITLKQVEPGAVGLPDDTFKEWAKQLSLPEQKWAVEIVKDLRREGVILNREVAGAFQRAAAAMPAGIDAEQWMQASAAAFKRGLPMTGATVAAFHQVMFGSSTHELLDALQQQLAVNGSSRADGAEQKQLNQAAARVLTLLAEGSELLRSAVSQGVNFPAQAQAADSSGKPSTVAAQAQAGMPARADSMTSGNASMPVTEAMDRNEATGQPFSRTAGSQPNWLGHMMKWLGVDHELQLTKAWSTDAQHVQGASSQKSPPAVEVNASAATAAAEQNRAVASAASAGTAQAANVNTAQNAAALQESQAGAEEQHVKVVELRQHADRAAVLPATQLAASVDGGSAGDQVQQTQQESLKSALLSLIASDDTLPAVKDTAQQLVQQITGQQLLLTPERNSSLLTHVTMFIPLQSPDGNQTASVHIQTRRGAKGELDASNCRLLFNLSMNTLGDTMVDVSVTDKIVSLNLWNDHPAIASLAEGSRAEIADSLHQAGYQLLSLRTKPLPKAGEPQTDAATATKEQQPPELSPFSSSRYKGVDYRI
ncbi:hypothetical protein [Paenibacillus sp. sgz302251]|uniref:hypothetical protein n=1 Tax=Paenibacillus sp. sgz302251 TaxID=3414493 RepID=UPI003C7E6445